MGLCLTFRRCGGATQTFYIVAVKVSDWAWRLLGMLLPCFVIMETRMLLDHADASVDYPVFPKTFSFPISSDAYLMAFRCLIQFKLLCIDRLVLVCEHYTYTGLVLNRGISAYYIFY